MDNKANNFIALADIALSNDYVQAAVSSGTRTAYHNRNKAMTIHGYEHGEAMRQQAAEAKRRALRQLPDLLETAEANLTRNGFTVLWAEDGEEACQHVLKIAREHSVQRIVKSKSMATEEIALNEALEEANLDVVETDLGQYILQLNGQHPSHIVAPVIHITKQEVRELFEEKLNMPPTDDSQQMVAHARVMLREAFLQADMGISGGNFVIAETGTLCLVTNEGNGRMVTSLPRVHVAIVGIEKLVENLQDYATLTQVLPRSGTGQNMTVYTNMINGPGQDGGPQHLYVIFLDNGRSDIYVQEKYVEVLACIRCGACQNACPVYRSVSGLAYGWVYGGPIGAVVTPLLKQIENAAPLPQASSLCGNCKEVCPVDIDLPRMLLELRHDLVERHEIGLKWNLGIKVWEQVHRSPWRFRWAGWVARVSMQLGLDRVVPSPLGEWRKYRDFPGFAPKSFRQLWQEREKNTHE